MDNFSITVSKVWQMLIFCCRNSRLCRAMRQLNCVTPCGGAGADGGSLSACTKHYHEIVNLAVAPLQEESEVIYQL